MYPAMMEGDRLSVSRAWFQIIICSSKGRRGKRWKVWADIVVVRLGYLVLIRSCKLVWRLNSDSFQDDDECPSPLLDLWNVVST